MWIDDGRIGGLIERVDEHGEWLRITRARPEGERLGADRGLDFPDSAINLPSLTERDLASLDIACRHADIVGLSFVTNAEDVRHLTGALAERSGKHIGIVAKIKTLQAVENLPDIIMYGAGRHPFGVMIARGDLAVERGCEGLAAAQEKIMWLCEAAHVPVVWVAQVLESQVKWDLPSRAEIIDAAVAERADCVMLNHGPYVLHALALLETVVAGMREPPHEKAARYRALQW